MPSHSIVRKAERPLPQYMRQVILRPTLPACRSCRKAALLSGEARARSKRIALKRAAAIVGQLIASSGPCLRFAERYEALGWLEARHLDLISPVWIATETGK